MLQKCHRKIHALLQCAERMLNEEEEVEAMELPAPGQTEEG